MATDDSFIRQVECGGSSLVIHQLMVGDEGCVVWDAALVLSKFLENPLYFTGHPKGYWKGRRVVELGGGTGVVGLAACALG
jgi:predicted nicotinamide N-methyase